MKVEFDVNVGEYNYKWYVFLQGHPDFITLMANAHKEEYDPNAAIEATELGATYDANKPENKKGSIEVWRFYIWYYFLFS